MASRRISKIFYGIANSAKKHSAEILTGIGVAGMIATVITAVKATPKALMAIQNKEREEKRKLKPKEVISVSWRFYILSAVTGVGSIACVIGASAVNTKRNAALATAYSLSESALKLYKDKVVETIGEKEAQKICDAVGKEHVSKNPVSTKEVFITDRGNTLCYDTISGRYFTSDMETIKKAVNVLNHRMLQEMYVSLNDFYDEIELDTVKIGDRLGWNINHGLVELSFSSQLASDGRPCLVLDYKVPPTYDFDRL